MLRRNALAALAIMVVGVVVTFGITQSTPRPAPEDDGEVLAAVLKHSIAPQEDQVFGSAGGRRSLLVVNETLPLCQGPKPKAPCISPRELESLLKHRPHAPSLPAWIDSFRERNATSKPLPKLRLDNVVLIRPDGWESLKAHATVAKGFTWFSLPAYRGGDRALVYASYTCGGLCGYGWFFELTKGLAGWEVVDQIMLWIS